MSSRDEFIGWARASAHPLTGTDLDLGDRDLEPLAGLVGPARIVGLGESWHCVREFLSVRFRIVRYLVERLGFTALLLEGSLATSTGFDDHVNGDGPEPVLSTLWNNPETRQFLAWLREHNASASRPVRVLGLDTNILIMDDVHQPGTSAESVVAYLEQADPAYRVPHLDTIRRIFADFPRGDPAANFSYLRTVDPAQRARMRAGLNHVIAQLQRHRAVYAHRTSPGEFQWAAHRAATVLHALDVYEAPIAEGTGLRDTAMAENAHWALDHLGPDTRAVILAHSAHIARQPWHLPGSSRPLPSTGGYLADWHGPGYLALTTTFGEGEFAAAHPITGTAAIEPGTPDSIDLAMHEAGSAPLLADLRDASGKPWLAAPRSLRTMGNLGWHLTYQFPEAFDALIHLDRIHLA